MERYETETVTGRKVTELRWNSMANMFLGKVDCPIFGRMMSGSWGKSGKCKNNTRPDLNIAKNNLPEIK
jgi:hypothetical protein